MLSHMFKLQVLILCVLSLFAPTALAEKIVIYGDEAYAPVIYLDHGKITGILPDIFANVSKDTGDTYELILVPWKRALQQSMYSKGGIVGISVTKEREKLFDFSQPIYDDDLQLVVLKGHEFIFNDLKDLKGKTIGGAAGAIYGEDFARAKTAGIIVIDEDPHQLSRMRKLLQGRMEVAIIGNGIAGFESLLASDPELEANRNKFTLLPRPLARDSLHLAFLKSMNMKPALARFNKALSDLKKTKEYKQIIMRHDKSTH